MKKNIPVQIQLTVILSDTGESFRFKVWTDTRFQEISNKIAAKLNLDAFRTSISFQTPYSFSKINQSSTLFQNGLTTSTVKLFANIDNISTKPLISTNLEDISIKNKLSSLDLAFKYPIKSKLFVDGITIEGLCVNKKCINHQREVLHPLGMGTYNLHEILNNLKCPACPYKDQKLNPSVVVKKLRFRKCGWTIEGNIKLDSGIEVPESFNNWIIVRQEGSTWFYQMLDQIHWTNLNIKVKPLVEPELSNYQKFSFTGNSFHTYKR